jgi:glycosyltransferase involved in cell wall biosynthesis
MTDVSILIPTHRHVAFLPYAIRSALDQEGAEVEVLVVGDGVEDATREVISGFENDPRVRFFDLPKGPRLGEAYRHRILLEEARGRIVSYLSDDDILLRDHLADIVPLLEDADFAHPATAWIEADGVLVFRPWDTARPEFAWFLRSGKGSIGLSGAAHTLEAYRRLPHGWRTTPAGMPTDRYMWLQWLDLPGFRGVTSRKLTQLHFPDPMWKGVPDEERARILADWFERSRRPGFREEIDALMVEAVYRGGENSRLQARKHEIWLESIQGTRTWRAHEWLTGFRPLRALLARRRGAR